MKTGLRSVIIAVAAILSMALAGCTTDGAGRMFASDYSSVTDAGYQLPAVSLQQLPSQFRRQTVDYETRERPGTIVVDTEKQVPLSGPGRRQGAALRHRRRARRLRVEGHQPCIAQGIPGRAGPRRRRCAPVKRARGNVLPAHMEGGPANPLGARALYIGSTIYRIHGTPEVHSIGQAMSSGCIRLINQDIIDLYNRVDVGARVVVM